VTLSRWSYKTTSRMLLTEDGHKTHQVTDTLAYCDANGIDVAAFNSYKAAYRRSSTDNTFYVNKS
jgi:hypothetical protein